MPTLEWIGKDKVINHHQEVPFRVLERKYSFDEQGQHEAEKVNCAEGAREATLGCNGSENMIIRGDNLEALKALLPRYEGRVKCIYIDPPYNTGNEGWVYNDNVNDPKIKKWLGEVVGKEGEDLSRHDKWLCMMYPRLKLLQKLLAEDGAIFISIDDNEIYNLKLICDEIFGANCFVSNISWQRTYSMRNDSQGIPAEIEHILVYSKKPMWIPGRLPRTEEMDSKYKNPDNDPQGPWQNTTAFAPGGTTHQGMVYAIQHPFTGKMMYPTRDAHWRYQQEQMLEIMRGWCKYELRELDDAHERAAVCGLNPDEVRQGVKAIVLSESLDISSQEAKRVYERGQWPRFYFTSGGKGGIRRKTYMEGVDGKPATNYWPFSETGHTDEAKKDLLSIFGGKVTFDTPKPARLIERVLTIATSQNSIILDSFAGSGTTAHAVLNMNKADGGNRHFILVEMMDYADSITAERVRRVINGYGEGKNAVEGTGGSFSFYDLGEPLMIGDCLNEAVAPEKIREYVWFMETKAPYVPAAGEHPYYLGKHNDTGYYFYYEPQSVTVLDYHFLATITEKASGTVIYADRCSIGEEKLSQMGIVFKKIPRDISKL